VTTTACTADLSVAEHLADGPLRAEEIAARESTDVGMTRRDVDRLSNAIWTVHA